MKELTMSEISHVFGGGSLQHSCTDSGCPDASQCTMKNDIGDNKDNAIMDSISSTISTGGATLGRAVGYNAAITGGVTSGAGLATAGLAGAAVAGAYFYGFAETMKNGQPVIDAEKLGEYMRNEHPW